MSRIVYLNGSYLPEQEAKISIFDRAVNFGDAIYEVAGVMQGKLVDFEHHMQRYQTSLGKLSMQSPLQKDEILAAFRQLVAVNEIENGLVYMQLTRGVAERDFDWPEGMQPNLFMFTQPQSAAEAEQAGSGLKLASVDDIRWARRDIKTVNLLGQVLAKRQAHEAGADEALMVDRDGFVTECASSSFFIVSGDSILTRPLNNDILPGVTRRAVLALCQQQGMQLLERKFTLEEAMKADEAFITAASAYLMAVVKIDDRDVGAGKPGPTHKKLLDLYLQEIKASLL